MVIEATDGIDKAIDKLTDLQKLQIPFAESRTVNALAYGVQQDTIRRLLPEKFNLRTDWWKPGRKTGVNYFPSHKRQYPEVKAIVNTLAPFMEMQETGGTKRPRPGEAFIPVPTYNAQPDKKQRIRPNRRYRALVKGGKAGRRTLMHRKSPWIGTLKNARPSVAVRLLDEFRLPIAVMYHGVDSVTIKPRFGFRANAQRYFNENHQTIWNREIANALATARFK